MIQQLQAQDARYKMWLNFLNLYENIPSSTIGTAAIQPVSCKYMNHHYHHHCIFLFGWLVCQRHSWLFSLRVGKVLLLCALIGIVSSCSMLVCWLLSAVGRWMWSYEDGAWSCRRCVAVVAAGGWMAPDAWDAAMLLLLRMATARRSWCIMHTIL